MIPCQCSLKRDILVAKKGSGIKINSLEDAKNVKRIGTLGDSEDKACKGFNV
jgi:hypothetical protein